jgi:hypothetical protein
MKRFKMLIVLRDRYSSTINKAGSILSAEGFKRTSKNEYVKDRFSVTLMPISKLQTLDDYQEIWFEEATEMTEEQWDYLLLSIGGDG